MTVKTQSGKDTGIPVVSIVQIPWCHNCGKERLREHFVNGVPICQICGQKLMYRVVKYPDGTIPVVDERYIEELTKQGYTGILGCVAPRFPVLDTKNIQDGIDEDARIFKMMDLDGEILVWDEQPCV
jgi:hypothetical protein